MSKKKQHRKQRVSVYMLEQGLEQIEKEAAEFDLKVSKYIAVILSHRKEIVEKIRGGEIVIVP